MDEAARARRWDLVLPHRERLLRLARTLVHDPGDAEACVQEALARCVTFEGLDESNVAGFLVTTTRRLCVDHHRATARSTRIVARLTGRCVTEPSPDEVVCDRAEAAWIGERLSDLPRRQRAVVMARAAGQTPQEIAERLAVSYKTVETLLYRVRTRARAELERAYGVVALFVARRPRAAWTALGATSVAVVTGASLLLVPGSPSHGAAPPPVPGWQAPDATTPSPAPRPLPLPAPTPDPLGARRTPPPWAATGSPSPTRVPPTVHCDTPPFQDPCVPTPGPSHTPLVDELDCVFYGVNREVGLDCNTSPTPSPSGPEDRPQEGNP